MPTAKVPVAASEPTRLIAGRYRLLQELGAGGMGVVWKAEHVVTCRPVALKMMRGPLQASPSSRNRFLREARAASAFDHPNVVEIHDALEDADGTPVLVMDLLDGETFRALLDREGALPVATAADILSSVVSAVGAAHAAGVLHRDLKPDNVFLTADSPMDLRVRVLDFGLAKLVGGSWGVQPASLTNTGMRLGTPEYMSPEQAEGSKGIDHRTDIWSIGVMLYEALSGTRPIEGANAVDAYRRVLAQAITPLGAVAPHVPQDLQRLVARLLMRDRTARPDDLREVLDALWRHATFRAPTFGAPSAEVIAALAPAGSVLVVTPDAEANATTVVQLAAVSEPTSRRARWLAVALLALAVCALLAWALRTRPDGGVARAPASSAAPPPSGAPSPPANDRAPALAPEPTVTAAVAPPPRAVPQRSGMSPAARSSAPRAEPREPELRGFVEVPPF